MAIPLATHSVSAVPGVNVDNPANVWAPYGPMVKNLVFQYYSDPNSEFNAFVAGKLDVTDWALPIGSFGAYDVNPDFDLSPTQGSFGIFGIYFNGGSSTWNSWGCNWSNSTGTTYTSQCGIEMRQAFAHLVNRGDFAHNNIANPSVGLADDTPNAGVPAGTPWATQCTWDASVMVKLGTSCYNHWNGVEPGAYTITGSGSSCTPTTPGTGPMQLYQSCSPGVGFPMIGSPDFCAAAIHMINAGVATGMTASCVLTGVNPGVFSHPLRFVIRITNPRLTLGNGFFNQLDMLFGGPAVTHWCVGGISQCGPIVFFDQPGQVDDWDAYTYGYSEGGPFGGSALFELYGSQFSSVNGTPNTGTPCNGATGGDEPANPTFVCNPRLDVLLSAQNNSTTIVQYDANTLAAMDYIGRIANDLVSYSPGFRNAALRSVAGLVNARGLGYNNFYTLLNAHQGSYVPTNPIYAFGGGDPTTLRYGQASETSQLNIFNAQTVWESQALGEIYDTLLSPNPTAPSQIICWMCTNYTTSVDSKGNEHFLVQLRQNLRWQDGVPIDAKDVAFSLLALRDLAPVFGGSIFSVLLSVRVLSNTSLDIVMFGQSIFYPVDLETQIMPRHLWECDLVPNVPSNDCANGAALIISAGSSVTDYTSNGFNGPSATRVSTEFDPVVNNALIGSGPFECKSLFQPGTIGGGCVMNSDGTQGGQAIPIGGKMVLTAFDNTASSADPFDQYMRSFNPAWGTGSGITAESGQFQEFSYADQGKTGSVTLFDLASVAACFDASGPTVSCSVSNYAYWQKTAFETVPGTISREADIVASHYGDTYVSPYAWNSVSLENIVGYP